MASEVDESKVDCYIKMFKRAVSLGFVMDFMLIGSWVNCEALINAVLKVISTVAPNWWETTDDPKTIFSARELIAQEIVRLKN